MTNATSRSYEDTVEEIRRGFTKPRDLKNSELILGQEVAPFIFTKITGIERDAYNLKMLHVGPSSRFVPKASSFRYDDDCEIIWDIDENVKGTFNEEGRFVLEERPENMHETMWFVQAKKNQMHGPFTLGEMKEKMKNGDLEHGMIKRDKDSVFVSFKRIQKICPNVFGDKDKIEEIFSNEEAKDVPKEVTGSIIAKNTKNKDTPRCHREITDEEVWSMIGGCSKSKAFLLRKKSRVRLEEVVEKARGRKKITCLKIISDITGMNKFDCEAFLDIFVSESKLPLCCDVDDDGFEVVS